MTSIGPDHFKIPLNVVRCMQMHSFASQETILKTSETAKLSDLLLHLVSASWRIVRF